MKNLIISILILASSCSNFYRVIDKTDRPKEIVNDERFMSYSKEENKFISVANVGFENIDTLDLFPGHIFEITPEKAYHLIVRNVDFSVYTFYSNFNELENIVELGIIRPTSNAIKLKNNCETIRWMDPLKIPKIEIDENLNTQQIVITPIMNNNCQKMGYEIRYGSQDIGGCKVEAKKVYEKYFNCLKNKNKSNKIVINTPRRYNLLDIIVE